MIRGVRKKLYLVDGMSHLYRAYYAIQGLTSRQGKPTNAVFGFTNMLRKLIVEEEPEYLGVAIDLSGPTVRHELFEEYKATRRPMPADLQEQVPDVLRICEVLRVPVLSFPGYEADDVIGTLSRKAEEEGLDVVVVTIDKDLFQLVDDRVSILDTRSMLRLDPAKVEEKFGVPPDQVVDVLALVGDSSDNIPGAPGIGQVGACKLIREFGGLEELLERRGEVSRKAYRESLQQHEDQIRQSWQLVRVHRDLDLDLDLASLQLSEPDLDAARGLFGELDFVSLLEEFLPPSQDFAGEYGPLRTPAELQGFLSGRETLALAFGSGQDAATAVPLAVAVEAGSASWFAPELARSPALLSGLKGSPAWVVHDLKSVLLREVPSNGLPERLNDTMLMAYLVNPNQTDFSLPRLALEYLQLKLEVDPAGGLFDLSAGQSAAQRADLVYRLWEKLMPELRAKGMERLLFDVEIPLVEVLASMERCGVKVDVETLKRMSREMAVDIEKLESGVYESAGVEFNLNSPKQLAEVLFEKLQLPVVKKTRKAGHYATGVEVLEKLAQDYEIARLILDYRELSKLKSTYLDALPKLANPETGRIHTSYNQMVASTGRLSSSNPNLQNIPVKSAVGREIRRAFVAEAGFQILAADYSQIELRVMAHLSEDPVLVEAFQRGEDIHDRTAREVFGMQAVANPAEFRRHAKVINFGIMYGLSAFGLAQSLKIPRREAQRFIDEYFQRYQGVKKWIDDTLSEARRTGFVTTLFGRIRPIPEIHSRNWNLRGFGERTAINAPIQGTAADLIKMAMVAIHRQLQGGKLESRLILQVHDELVFEVRESEVETLKQLVKEAMEEVTPLRVPLRVELAVGPSWFDAK